MLRHVLFCRRKGVLDVKIAGLGQCKVNNTLFSGCTLFAYVMQAYKKLAGKDWLGNGAKGVDNWELVNLGENFIEVRLKKAA